MHSLMLHAKLGAWRMFAARKADPKFQSFMQKVLNRDRYTCQFCGFQAREFQEVVNVDNDYSNNKISNMATACVFCTQCFFLESVGVGDYGGGTLVYLPEVTQNSINSFCHVLFCAITNDTGYKTSAQSVYRSIKFRSQIVEEQFGEGTSDPGIFGRLIIDSGLEENENIETAMSNLRLLPSRAKFRTQIERWAATALEELAQEEGETNA